MLGVAYFPPVLNRVCSTLEPTGEPPCLCRPPSSGAPLHRPIRHVNLGRTPPSLPLPARTDTVRFPLGSGPPQSTFLPDASQRFTTLVDVVHRVALLRASLFLDPKRTRRRLDAFDSIRTHSSMAKGGSSDPTDAVGAGKSVQALPPAEFIEDVEAWAGRRPEEALQKLQENYQTYKMLEAQLVQNQARLERKLPDVVKALEVVQTLVDQRDTEKELQVEYELSDGIYAKAKVESGAKVCLWLGANVMLEYDLDEAKQLLEENLANAKQNLETNKKDRFFVRDCITITEVSISRVYNYDVVRRRKEKVPE